MRKNYFILLLLLVFKLESTSLLYGVVVRHDIARIVQKRLASSTTNRSRRYALTRTRVQSSLNAGTGECVEDWRDVLHLWSISRFPRRSLQERVLPYRQVQLPATTRHQSSGYS